MTLNVIQGHDIRPLVCQNHFYVIKKFCDFFSSRPSNLITTYYGQILSLFNVIIDQYDIPLCLKFE